MIENWTEMQPTLFNVWNIQFWKYSLIIQHSDLFSNVNWPKDCFQMSMFIVMISSWIGFLMMDMQQKQQHRPKLKMWKSSWPFQHLNFNLSKMSLKAIKLKGNKHSTRLHAWYVSPAYLIESLLTVSWILGSQKLSMRMMSVPSSVTIHYCQYRLHLNLKLVNCRICTLHQSTTNKFHYYSTHR